MKTIEELIAQQLKRIIQDAIQSVELDSFFDSAQGVEELLGTLNEEALKAISLEQGKVMEYFATLGKKSYKQHHVSLFMWIYAFESIKDAILYAIHHKLVAYSDDEFTSRINTVIQGFCKGYLHSAIKETLLFSYSRLKAIDIEMDIMIHERWYKSFLEYLSGDTNDCPELLYEKSASYRWLQSLDFQLLMQATTFARKSEIIILKHKIYDIAREIVQFRERKDFKNAYNSFVLLEQQIRTLNDLLKEVLINFLDDKLRFFFLFFSKTIFFKKEFSYFLTTSIRHSSETIHPKDAHKMLLRLYKAVKQKASKASYNLTGVVNGGDAMHLLFQYNNKEDVANLYDFVKQTATQLQKEEAILSVPKFIIRAAETESFSGLDASMLQKISLKMATEHADTDHYHFDLQESAFLREDAHNDSAIEQKVLQAISDERIELYFQPIVHVTKKSRELVYCEVLARVEDKEDVVDAESFISTIIENQLTFKFDMLVYEKLAKHADEIVKSLNGVSINIFPSSFQDTKTIEALKGCLRNFEQNSLFLILEITEYNLFENYNILVELKEEYKDTLQIAVDDFGSGYSSLASLMKLSRNHLLDILKIDGSLIENIVDDATSYEIVKTAAALSNSLGTKMITEYVKDAKIEQKLKTITQEFYAQGYLYAKALPLEKIEKFTLN